MYIQCIIYKHMYVYIFKYVCIDNMDLFMNLHILGRERAAWVSAVISRGQCALMLERLTWGEFHRGCSVPKPRGCFKGGTKHPLTPPPKFDMEAENRPKRPKKEIHLPTIDFQVLLLNMLVSGRVYFLFIWKSIHLEIRVGYWRESTYIHPHHHIIWIPFNPGCLIGSLCHDLF